MNEHETHELISIDVAEKQILIELERISNNSRGEPLTWGPTPLISTREVSQQQIGVKGEIASLFEDGNIPELVSPQLAIYIEMLNMSHTANRENENQVSFICRENMDLHGVPLEALEVLNRALMGSASPAELLFVQSLLGIPSIELASLTHPYGQRIEQLGEMRGAVNEAIVLMGGYAVEDTHPVFEVKGSDNPHHPWDMQGVHITRTTIFGYLENGTKVCEQSSAVILLDQLGPELAAATRAVPFENNRHWTAQVARACNLLKLAPALFSDDEHEKVIPIATTMVSLDPIMVELLLSKESKQTRQTQHYRGVQASKI
jgi:hypothetical protein